jgi:hypothetical protein
MLAQGSQSLPPLTAVPDGKATGILLLFQKLQRRYHCHNVSHHLLESDLMYKRLTAIIYRTT